MQRNVWHRTLCGASVQQWTEDVLPTDADCAACADAPQPAQPDAAALRAVLVDLVNACLLWDSDEDGYEWGDVMAVVRNAENVLAARAAAGGGNGDS